MPTKIRRDLNAKGSPEPESGTSDRGIRCLSSLGLLGIVRIERDSERVLKKKSVRVFSLVSLQRNSLSPRVCVTRVRVGDLVGAGS